MPTITEKVAESTQTFTTYIEKGVKDKDRIISSSLVNMGENTIKKYQNNILEAIKLKMLEEREENKERIINRGLSTAETNKELLRQSIRRANKHRKKSH
jgi:hypothetical protein